MTKTRTKQAARSNEDRTEELAQDLINGKPLDGGTTRNGHAPPKKKRVVEVELLTPEQKLDQILWEHGANVGQWANFQDILEENGLHPKHATVVHLKEAERRFRDRLNAELRVKVHASRKTIWEKLKSTPAAQRDEAWRNDLVDFLAQETGVFAQALLDTRNIKGSRCDLLLQEAGIPPETITKEACVESERRRRAWREKYAEERRRNAPPPEPEKAAPAEGAPPRAEKAPAKAPAPKAAGTDRFGTKLSSPYAKANAVLTTAPKSMKQIVQEAELKDTCYSHMNKLVAAGLVRKKDGGFCLPEVEGGTAT